MLVGANCPSWPGGVAEGRGGGSSTKNNFFSLNLIYHPVCACAFGYRRSHPSWPGGAIRTLQQFVYTFVDRAYNLLFGLLDEPEIRLQRLPAVGVFGLRFVIGNRRNDDHFVAVLPVGGC